MFPVDRIFKARKLLQFAVLIVVCVAVLAILVKTSVTSNDNIQY